MGLSGGEAATGPVAGTGALDVGFVWALLLCVTWPHDHVSIRTISWGWLGGRVVAVQLYRSLIARLVRILTALGAGWWLFYGVHSCSPTTITPMAENYSNVLCLGSRVPRYFIGEFALVGGLVICAAAQHRLWPGVVTGGSTLPACY